MRLGIVPGMAEARGASDQRAAATGLGRPSGAFGNVRYIPPKVAWAVVGGAAACGILMAVVGAYVIALLAVPIALLALAVVRYRVTPVGGRRWLLLYEHGMAEVTRTPGGVQSGLRVVHWREVTAAVPDPARPGSYALTVAAAAGEPAPPVTLADFGPAAKLRGRLARHLPQVPWPTGVTRGHSRVALTALGFTALAVVPALVPIVRTTASPPAATNTAETVTRPTPSVATSRAESPTAAASSAPSSPAVRILPLPSDMVDFYDACKGPVMFPSAPPFSGPPPHRVSFPVPPSFGDKSWRATQPSDVQLIVCTKRSAQSGATVRNCTYQTSDGPFTQQLTKTTWTITLFEARTGRQVAQSSVVGGTTSCLPGLLPDYDTYPPTLSKIQETSLTERQAYETVGKYVLR
jgi:hypothetical protein